MSGIIPVVMPTLRFTRESTTRVQLPNEARPVDGAWDSLNMSGLIAFRVAPDHPGGSYALLASRGSATDGFLLYVNGASGAVIASFIGTSSVNRGVRMGDASALSGELHVVGFTVVDGWLTTIGPGGVDSPISLEPAGDQQFGSTVWVGWANIGSHGLDGEVPFVAWGNDGMTAEELQQAYDALASLAS